VTANNQKRQGKRESDKNTESPTSDRPIVRKWGPRKGMDEREKKTSVLGTFLKKAGKSTITETGQESGGNPFTPHTGLGKESLSFMGVRMGNPWQLEKRGVRVG